MADAVEDSATAWCYTVLGGIREVSQDRAAELAPKYLEEAVYFFAELTTDSDEALRHTNFRDAGSGQFVTEAYAEENPSTTVSET